MVRMGPQSDGKPAHDHNNAITQIPSARSSESKMVFIAEYGYLLAGGGLCFLLGIMLTLVIVWIIILICNRQIAMERIGAQSKIAATYVEYSMQNEALRKPYLDLSKIFNCTDPQRRLAVNDHQFMSLETRMELAFEAGMRWTQELINRSAYAGLFTTIFAAAVLMLLIEIFSVVVFIVYERHFKDIKSDEEADRLNQKYSFLIQGPKVIHHGVFEVSNTLSSANLQIKNLVAKASNSITDIKTKISSKPGPRDTRNESALTDMTITVRPPATPLSNTSSPQARSPVPHHPLTWHPYRGSRPPEESDSISGKQPSHTDSESRTEFSKSVGLNTLREHLDKHNLLIPLSEHNSEESEESLYQMQPPGMIQVGPSTSEEQDIDRSQPESSSTVKTPDIPAPTWHKPSYPNSPNPQYDGERKSNLWKNITGEFIQNS